MLLVYTATVYHEISLILIMNYVAATMIITIPCEIGIGIDSVVTGSLKEPSPRLFRAAT